MNLAEQVISNCLRKGGFWINLGPLLYHWADATGIDSLSIELSMEEILRVAGLMGFKLLKKESIEAPYMSALGWGNNLFHFYLPNGVSTDPPA